MFTGQASYTTNYKIHTVRVYFSNTHTHTQQATTLTGTHMSTLYINIL